MPTPALPYIPSYEGHGGGFRKPGPGRPGCRGRRRMSSDIDTLACCSKLTETVLILVARHTHRTVLLSIRPGRRLDRPDNLWPEGIPWAPPRRIPQSPIPQSSLLVLDTVTIPPVATAYLGGICPRFLCSRPVARPSPEVNKVTAARSTSVRLPHPLWTSWRLVSTSAPN